MKRLPFLLSRDGWLALGLFLLLTLVTVISMVQQAQASLVDPPLASFSNQPNGSRALWLYLESQQIDLTDSMGSLFGVP